MQSFEVYSHEIDQSKVMEAQGIAEVMLDYLPWPTLDISINWSPSNGRAEVTDNKTYFKYIVKLL